MCILEMNVIFIRKMFVFVYRAPNQTHIPKTESVLIVHIKIVVITLKRISRNSIKYTLYKYCIYNSHAIHLADCVGSESR